MPKINKFNPVQLVDNPTKLLLHFDGTNGSTSIKDEVGNVVTVAGNTQISTAQSKFGGSSLLLDGNGDYIYIPNFDIFSGTSSFTIDFWVYFNNLAEAIFCEQRPDANNLFYLRWRGTSNNRIDFYVASGGVSQFQCRFPFTPSTGQWYHIAIVRNSISSYYGFVNGVSQTITYDVGTSSTSLSQPSGNVNIGGRPSVGDLYLNGYLDEFRIVKGQALWTSNFSVPTQPYNYIPSPKLYLKCEGTNGSTIISDETGKYVPTVNGNAQISTAQYKFGTSSLYLDGSGDYLSIPDSTDWQFGSGDFTVEMWVYLTSVPSNADAYLVGYTDSSPTNGWNLMVSNFGGNTYLGVQFYSASVSPFFQLFTVKAFATSTWYHIALVKSGTNVKTYVDGTQLGSNTTSGTIGLPSQALQVGRKVDNSKYIAGYIDELMVWKGYARYTSNFTPATGSEALLLHFDGQNGSTAITDETGKTVTVAGNAQISTAQSKFGGSSLLLDGNGDYLTLANSSDFNISSGAFTIDFWFYSTGSTGVVGVVSKYQAASPYTGWTLSLDRVNNKFKFYSDAGTQRIVQSGTTSQNAWHHFALVSDGTTITMYVDGTSQGTWVGNPQEYNNILYIGAEVNQTNPSFSGYIDEFRIVKGQALWTSNFTPPTAYTAYHKEFYPYTLTNAKINFPGFQKILDFTATGNESSVNLPVNGDVDKEYLIFYNAISSPSVQCRLNNDTSSIYGYQYLINSGGSISAARGLDNKLTGAPGYVFIRLFTPIGFPKTTITTFVSYSSGTTIGFVQLDSMVYNNTANIFVINFLAASGTFSKDTNITVYARRSYS